MHKDYSSNRDKRILVHLPLSQDDPFSSNSPFPLFLYSFLCAPSDSTDELEPYLNLSASVQNNLERELRALIKDCIIMNMHEEAE